jgi:hypothetical protein
VRAQAIRRAPATLGPTSEPVQRGRGIHVGWRPNAQPPGYPSATTILPQYQHVQVGTWMPMARTVTQTTALTVTAFETASWLLWEKPDSTWAWQLIPDDGGRTRLISRLRQRYRWQTPGSALLTVILLEFGDYPMMRRLLKGIKDRSEHKKNGRSPDTPTNPPPGHEHDVADS